MVIDNIYNMINIIENKEFKGTFYEHFIYEEELAAQSIQPTPPTLSQNIKSKTPGVLLKGGLLAGGALLAHHVLKSNPDLNNQIHELGRNIKDGTTHGLKAINDKAHEVGKHIADSKAASAADADWKSHMNPSLNTPDEMKKHAEWLSSQKNNSNLTFNQREELAKHEVDFAKNSADKYAKQYIPNDIAKNIDSSHNQFRSAEDNKALEVARGENVGGRNSQHLVDRYSYSNLYNKFTNSIANKLTPKGN